ncbi:MAG: MFS transporter [Pirellulales bacterium]
MANVSQISAAISAKQRYLALAAAFLGWMFAGLQISSFALVTRPAILSMSEDRAPQSAAGRVEAERDAKVWFSWYQAAFLLGAAAGGWVFGALGDRVGRARALGYSVLTYSVVAGAGYFATTPEALLAVRFISCLGVGGVWPTAVALVSETWSDFSRPLLAGLLGTAANFGFVFLGLLGGYRFIVPEDWRWVMLVCAAPAAIGAATLLLVREPPRWLAGRAASTKRRNSLGEVLRPPYLRRTILGVVLAAVPVVGTAVNAVWVTPWSDHVSSQRANRGDADEAECDVARPSQDRTRTVRPKSVQSSSWLPRFDDSRARAAWTQVTRSSGAALGSLLGGWLATLAGRRLAYFLISLASLGISATLYGRLDPSMPHFSWFVFALGFAGVTYFGWLPLYLPELFPTRIRATGTGVTFNSGRVVAAVAAIATASAIMSVDNLNYAQIGLWTSGIYAIGLVAILFAPDTSQHGLED